jgi:hypothetical protein
MTIPCEVIECLPKHLTEMGAFLRAEDVAEVEAMGMSPRKALWTSYRASHFRRSYVVGGKIAAIGGCGGSLLSPIGSPWLLTTPLVEADPVSFAREARRQVRGLLEIHPTLRNYVDARYSKAIGFLELIGFTVGGDERQINGHTFVKYEMVA